MSSSIIDKLMPQLMNVSEKLSKRYPEGAKVAEQLIVQLMQAPLLWGSMKERIKAQGINPEALKAWAKDGKEFLLSHEQVKTILGHEMIAQLSQKLNTSQEKIIEQAQSFLPLAIGLIQEAEARLQKAPWYQWISSTLGELTGSARGQEREPKSAPTAAPPSTTTPPQKTES